MLVYVFGRWLITYMSFMSYRHEHQGPAIAVIECPNAQLMKSGIRALDDFPCVSIPCNARDSQYQVVY